MYLEKYRLVKNLKSKSFTDLVIPIVKGIRYNEIVKMILRSENNV